MSPENLFLSCEISSYSRRMWIVVSFGVILSYLEAGMLVLLQWIAEPCLRRQGPIFTLCGSSKLAIQIWSVRRYYGRSELDCSSGSLFTRPLKNLQNLLRVQCAIATCQPIHYKDVKRWRRESIFRPNAQKLWSSKRHTEIFSWHFRNRIL